MLVLPLWQSLPSLTYTDSSPYLCHLERFLLLGPSLEPEAPRSSPRKGHHDLLSHHPSSQVPKSNQRKKDVATSNHSATSVSSLAADYSTHRFLAPLVGAGFHLLRQECCVGGWALLGVCAFILLSLTLAMSLSNTRHRGCMLIYTPEITCHH